MKNRLLEYNNGDYVISLFEDGTLIKETNSDNPQMDFPITIDVKITNFCNLSHICTYCHEQSDRQGQHADLNKLFSVLSELPPGPELAIGGGNPLSHPDLRNFLYNVKQKGLFANLTVNQLHLKQYHKELWDLINNDLVKGMGISFRKYDINESEGSFSNYEHSVVHLIAGIDSYETISILLRKGFRKFLILGYKQFGNGISHYEKFGQSIEDNLQQWKMYLPKYFGKCIISFDNLAIEQLKVKRFFTGKGWNRFYMGDDFTQSMYIDAVEQKFSPTSRSNDRNSFSEFGLVDYFQKFKNIEYETKN